MVFGKLKIFDRSFLIWCDESQLAICVYGETYYSPQSGSITVPNFSAGSVSGISPGAGRGGEGVRSGLCQMETDDLGRELDKLESSILETQEDDDDAEVVDEHVNDVRNTARWG